MRTLGFWTAAALGIAGAVTERPLAAGLLDLLWWGLIAWAIHRGSAWASVVSALLTALIAWAAVPGQPVHAAVLGASSVAFTAAAVSAFKSRGWCAGDAAWLVRLALVAVAAFFVRPMMQPSGSMEPTVHAGERYLMESLSFEFSEPRRGDPVVFRSPADPRQIFLQRVAGVPGDRVRMESLPGGEGVVPAGSYFLLGDNRRDAVDSRYRGFVGRGAIVGRAFLVYASRERPYTPRLLARGGAR